MVPTYVMRSKKIEKGIERKPKKRCIDGKEKSDMRMTGVSEREVRRRVLWRCIG